MSDTAPMLVALAIAATAAVLFLVATVLTVRVSGWQRLYWACCAVLIAGGGAGAASALCCLPPTILPDGSISGEMPPVFGAGLMVAAMGCGGALLGLFAVRLTAPPRRRGGGRQRRRG